MRTMHSRNEAFAADAGTHASEPSMPVSVMAPGADYLLQDIVDMVEGGLVLSLTLHLGGSVVTGTLVDGGRYFRRIAAAIDAATPDTGREALMHRLNAYAAVAGPKSYVRPPATYVHLENARCWVHGGTSSPIGLWRGRIADISGFSLGGIAAPEHRMTGAASDLVPDIDCGQRASTRLVP